MRAEIAVFVLNLSDIMFLRTAPHTKCRPLGRFPVGVGSKMDLSNPSCGICRVANHRSWVLPIRKKVGLFFLGEQRKTFLFQSSLNKLPPSNFHVLVNFCFQLHALLLFWTSPSASMFVSKHCWSGYIILNTVTNRL